MRLMLASGDGRKAFTLMEIMIVVVVIGIVTAAILPQMGGTYDDALLRSDSRELLNACSLASSRAISFNQPYRVRFDRRAERYLVEKLLTERDGEHYVPLRDVPGGEGRLDPRVNIRFFLDRDAPPEGAAPETSPVAAEEVIGFYPDGTADAGTILLQDRQGVRLALRINPTTARVRVIELGRESDSAAANGGAR